MPLFDGIPFFNRSPQDTQSDGHTQAALARGLDRGFQARAQRENLVERQRQFDALQSIRDTEQNLQEARLQQFGNEIEDRKLMAQWMNRVNQSPDAINDVPQFKTLQGLQAGTEFRQQVTARKFELGNKNSTSDYMSMVGKIKNPELRAGALEILREEGGPTSKAWRALNEATAQDTAVVGDGITTGFTTSLFTEALKLEQYSDVPLIPRDTSGRITGDLPDLDLLTAAAKRKMASQAGKVVADAKLDMLATEYKEEVRSINERANNIYTQEFKTPDGKVNTEAKKAAIDKAGAEYMKKLLNATEQPSVPDGVNTLEDFIWSPDTGIVPTR